MADDPLEGLSNLTLPPGTTLPPDTTLPPVLTLPSGTTLPPEWSLDDLNRTTLPGPWEVRAALVEERTNTSRCDAGYLCQDNEQVNCTLLQYVPIVYGLGKLHAGLSCPEGVETYQNCPAGSYCPTPESVEDCPAGYFCPHKTAVPEAICHSCTEGTPVLERATYGYFIIAAVCAFAFAVFVVRVVHRRQQKRIHNLFRSLGDRVESVRTERALRRQRKQMLQIQPQLEILARRLQSSSILKTSSLDVKDNDDGSGNMDTSSNTVVTFDARELFDYIDTNHDGLLSYDELNTLLQLDAGGLRDFVRRMNERGGSHRQEKCVSRSVFLRHFVAVLAETKQLRPTPEEAGAVFDDMVKEFGTNRRKELELHYFYDSEDLTSFLRDEEIYNLVLSFQEIVRAKQAKRNDDPPGRRNSTPILSLRNSSRRSVLVQELGFSSVSQVPAVSRNLFVEHYPELLVHAMNDSDPERADTKTAEAIESGEAGVDITFEDLSLSVKVGDKKVKVVDNVTDRFGAGTMVSLMGGSGAGKSSLLNALCGRAFYGETTGNVLINGQESSIEEHRGSVGFVPQDDIVYPELTVRENFVYSGRFQLPRGTPIHEIHRLADETLVNLGLVRVASSPVGDVYRRGVSGGEKKRVNIGLEVMKKPRALFLDEPTSGLDSSSALLVMKSLRKLVEIQGVTVCSVIHQPRNYL